MPTLTLTLDVPEELADRLWSLSERDRSEYALSLLQAGAAAEDALSPAPPIDYEAEREALNAAFVAIESCKERPAADVFADLAARHQIK